MRIVESVRPIGIQGDFSDRPPINNIWDQDQAFTKLKKVWHDGAQLQDQDEVEVTGRALLEDADPYKVKLGIHLLRLGIWKNQRLAQDWVNHLALPLLDHPHPRVRHSALWNVRSAVWQDTTLASGALRLARAGLGNSDPAVQRVSMWTHGDAVINDPELFSSAITSMQEFLRTNPKESNNLFALEEFFMPLRARFSGSSVYEEAISIVRDASDGYPGVKARCDNIFGHKITISEEDRGIVRGRLDTNSRDLPLAELIQERKYEIALKNILLSYPEMETFIERMKSLWIMRDLSWVTGESNIPAFRQLSSILADTRDGDLTRTASVLLADNVVQFPEVLAPYALEAANSFFTGSDIDGSQIVVAQTLTSLKTSSAITQNMLNDGATKLRDRAANKSVEYAIDCLVY